MKFPKFTLKEILYFIAWSSLFIAIVTQIGIHLDYGITPPGPDGSLPQRYFYFRIYWKYSEKDAYIVNVCNNKDIVYAIY